MLTAVVTLAGESLVAVHLRTSTLPPGSEPSESTGGEIVDEVQEQLGEHEAIEELDTGPSPIMPELKELLWGGGAFIVLAVVMRYALFPRLRTGMQARYDSIQQGFTDADRLRDEAKAEVAKYEADLATVRAEANAVVDAARQTLEGERQAALTEANAAIAQRRAAAAAEVDAARQAAAGQVGDAVGSVATTLVTLATGVQPSPDALRQALESVTEVRS